ncbi:MAG TPA: hypothetical protein DCL48_06195 [Alphaproteobacteria bacterium]|nr:hypothetical protein [Alphaproteobacteria bacterium]
MVDGLIQAINFGGPSQEYENILLDTLAFKKDFALELSLFERDRAAAPICAGLIAWNVNLDFDSKTIPSGEVRGSFNVNISEEPGGPAYVVSRVLQGVGEDTFLVGHLDDDVIDKNIQTKLGQSSSATIYTDYLEVTKHIRKTRVSYILQPETRSPDAFGQRVILEESIDSESADLPRQYIASLQKRLKEHPNRVLFFDKFLQAASEQIIRILSPLTWTVFEPGTRGTEDLSVERRLFGKVNFLVCSFPFAQKVCGNTISPFLSIREYSGLIDDILGDIEKFVSMLMRAEVVQSMLRKAEEPRIVIVTLGAKGSMIICDGLDQYSKWYFYQEGFAPSRNYNSKAGDVFRGALVSILVKLKKLGFTGRDLQEREYWPQIAKYSSKCSSVKLGFDLMDDALPEIANLVEECIVRCRAVRASM